MKYPSRIAVLQIQGRIEVGEANVWCIIGYTYLSIDRRSVPGAGIGCGVSLPAQAKKAEGLAAIL